MSAELVSTLDAQAAASEAPKAAAQQMDRHGRQSSHLSLSASRCPPAKHDMTHFARHSLCSLQWEGSFHRKGTLQAT